MKRAGTGFWCRMREIDFPSHSSAGSDRGRFNRRGGVERIGSRSQLSSCFAFTTSRSFERAWNTRRVSCEERASERASEVQGARGMLEAEGSDQR